MRPWELHPVLIHFPIAFLLGGLIIDLVAKIRPREAWTRAASGLIAAGVLSGIAAAFAGIVSYFTVPAHTEAAHGQMDVHLFLASAALIVFAPVAFARWQRRSQSASPMLLSAELMGSALLIAAAFLGGKIVYNGGAGVDPQILAPSVVQGHHHHGGADDDADHDHAQADVAPEAEHAHASGPTVHDDGAADDRQHHAHGRRVAVRRAPYEPMPLFDPDEDLKSPPGYR